MAEPETATVEKTVEVVAPSDLNGGYEFFVDAGSNTSYKVRVPDGGVKSGQRFQAVIVSDPVSRGSHNIPFGRWRDGLCDCCAFGCCHPVCCLTFWCQLCSLGQVLTRMKLYWTGGEPLNGETPKPSACVVLFIVALVNIVIANVFNFIYQSGIETTTHADGTTSKESTNDWASFVSSIWWLVLFIFTVVVTLRFRANLRRKYNIPEQSCNGCEDCCCAFWCQPCTICQMHRHTADFRAYPAGCCQCCTEKGLPPGAPDVV